ncbi:MAG TPA: dsRBD fold-containing protein [Kineosporiaceae bacterium]
MSAGRGNGAAAGQRAPEHSDEEVAMLTTTTWSVEIQLFEGDDDTAARATLISGEGVARRRTVTGSGRAHRNETDVPVAEIGAEIATARALRDLAEKLLEVAWADIAAIEHQDVHPRR